MCLFKWNLSRASRDIFESLPQLGSTLERNTRARSIRLLWLQVLVHALLIAFFCEDRQAGRQADRWPWNKCPVPEAISMAATALCFSSVPVSFFIGMHYCMWGRSPREAAIQFWMHSLYIACNASVKVSLGLSGVGNDVDLDSWQQVGKTLSSTSLSLHYFPLNCWK